MAAVANLFIVSAPSGAGKTSLLKALVANDEHLAVSVSHTTRAPRPGEVDGEHYRFVGRSTFEQLIGKGAFLEYARVFDNYYGTAEASVRGLLEAGRDVILEIDWQGARQVRKRFAAAVSVFILPPSLESLGERLRKRGQDAEEIIQRRMRNAISEMVHYREFDYLVINDDFDQALEDLRCIVSARRSTRASRQPQLEELLGDALRSAGSGVEL